MSERKAIFISHATPEDNEFTIWLGAKLTALGYEVWADVLRLNGGDDWQRKLENALRERACKVLFIANEKSVEKQGVRNEIQIATDVGKKIGDSNFIIPLRLGPFEAPFLIAHAQYIDFSKSWALGLQELLQALENEYKVPRDGGSSTQPWFALQSIHGKQLTENPERLISNWLEVRRLPEYLYFYPLPKLKEMNVHLTYPEIRFKNGCLTCEFLDIPGRQERLLTEALNSGWPRLDIAVEDMRRQFTYLANQALDRVLEAKGLHNYVMAGRVPTWWIGAELPDGRISFRWPQNSGSRQLQGFSAKRNTYWHFGATVSFRSEPFQHIRIKSRLVFSVDRSTPLESKPRMHRLRRSFAKSWRNERWRDMLLAFLYWFSAGATVVDIPMGTDQNLVLSVPPLSYMIPISIAEEVAEEEVDDPDVEFIREEELSDEE